ncbi:hypothetical protein ACHAWF_001149 [Thalassiosira exigua]
MREQLLVAKARWPEAIDMSLSPYALCQAACNDYLVPQNDEGLSKLDLFGNLRLLVGSQSSAGTVELGLISTSASLHPTHATSSLCSVSQRG